MTAGWAALNTLREYQSRALEPLSYYAPSKKEVAAALALVEQALEAAEDELRRQGCLCAYSRCPIHGESEGKLAAALRAVREGK